MGFFPELRGRRLYNVMKFICGCSFMMYGYDAGVLGGVLLHKPFLDAIGNPTGTYIIPMITASYSLAACVTSLFVATFAFAIGRRMTIILGCVVAIVGSVIQTSAYSVAQLIVGRGFAVGCISSAVPTYLAETGTEIGDRGPANALNALMLISGVPIAYWIDYGFVQSQAQYSWRLPIFFQCIFAGLSGICMFFLPDTPRWYYARNRVEEGDQVLVRLNDKPLESEECQATKHEIMVAIQMEEEASASLHWKQFLTLGIVDQTPMKIVRRICICFWLPMIREWMGSSLVGYYAAVILQGVGAAPSLVSILAGVLTTFAAVGCIPLYYTVEKLGRRTILMYGAMILSLFMLIFTVLLAVPPTPSIQWAKYWNHLRLGCVWLYCSEIAPLEYRHIGGSATAFGEWLMTFITVFAGPIGLTDIGWHFWLWVLAGNIIGVAFVFFLCPETGGKTLEQVDFLFTKSAFAFKSMQMAEEDFEHNADHSKASVTEVEMK